MGTMKIKTDIYTRQFQDTLDYEVSRMKDEGWLIDGQLTISFDAMSLLYRGVWGDRTFVLSIDPEQVRSAIRAAFQGFALGYTQARKDQ